MLLLMFIDYYIDAHVNGIVNSLGGKMTTDEIGVYLVDQVVKKCDNRTFNPRIEKIPVKSMPAAESSLDIQRPKSFTSDFKGKLAMLFHILAYSQS